MLRIRVLRLLFLSKHREWREEYGDHQSDQDFESGFHLKIASFGFIQNIVARASRDRHHSQCRVLTADRSKAGSISYEEIPDVPGLIPLVEHRSPGIRTHPRSAG